MFVASPVLRVDAGRVNGHVHPRTDGVLVIDGHRARDVPEASCHRQVLDEEEALADGELDAGGRGIYLKDRGGGCGRVDSWSVNDGVHGDVPCANR